MYSEAGGATHTFKKRIKTRKLLLVILSLVVVLAGAGLVYKLLSPTSIEKAAEQIQFDSSVSEKNKSSIQQAIQDQSKTYEGSVTASVTNLLKTDTNNLVLSAFVPVTNVYSTRQQITLSELKNTSNYVTEDSNEDDIVAIATSIGVDPATLKKLSTPIADIEESAIVFAPAESISTDVKLLKFEEDYYLDNFQSGGVFRQAVFTGTGSETLQDLKLNNLDSKETVLKVNMTGVTALTRLMMTKLAAVKDATYFSELIGDYLANADITHVSNEVSFKDSCQISYTVFCSPPEMIETLKASGVDIIELTGNHNNDVGSQYNTETINLYKSLGWQTIGGGLNAAEAAKFYTANQKNSKISFLAYNYPDSPNGTAIAGTDTAGANSFDFERIKTDIENAKQQSGFTIVNVQFWECYAYPDGYVEFPQCDGPIPDQKEVFRKLVDLGADMVIGSSAHQPQTYEFYNGKPIYYGLGNLYFDQTQWPGTERGIILTHYFAGDKLLQTKLAPTVYGKELQTRLMTDEESLNLLERLHQARLDSGL